MAERRPDLELTITPGERPIEDVYADRERADNEAVLRTAPAAETATKGGGRAVDMPVDEPAPLPPAPPDTPSHVFNLVESARLLTQMGKPTDPAMLKAILDAAGAGFPATAAGMAPKDAQAPGWKQWLDQVAKLLGQAKTVRGGVGEPRMPGGGLKQPVPAPPAPHVNVTTVGAPAEVKNTLQQINAAFSTRLAEHRQRVTGAQTAGEARGAMALEEALALDVETAVLDRVKGTALRDLRDAAVTYADDLRKQVLAGEDVGEELVRAVAVAGELVVRDEAIARNMARGLQARVIESQAARAGLGTDDVARVAATLATDPAMDPQLLAQMLTTLSKAQQRTFFGKLVALAKQGRSALHTLWIEALLSGPVTHAANITGNALATAWAIPERMFSAMMGRGGPVGLWGPRQVFLGEPIAQVRGFVQAFKDILTLNGEAFEKARQVGASKAFDRATGVRSIGLPPESTVGSFLDFLSALRPTSLLTSEDMVFKLFNLRMETAAQAWRTAALEGRRGRAFYDRVKFLENNPTPQMRSEAERFAALQTFTAELDGITGGIGSVLVEARKKVPPLHAIIPFVVTPTNMAQYSLQRTPLLNGLSTTLWRDLKAGGSKAALARGKIVTSGMVGAVFSTYAMTNLYPDNPVPYMTFITGGGPKDKDKQANLRAMGWQPYSVRIGEQYVSYNRLDPVGMTMGMVADYHEIKGQAPDEDWTTLAMAGTLAISKSLTSKTYLEGIANVIETIEDPERNLAKIPRSLARTLIPTAVRQAQKSGIPGLTEGDPTVKEVNSLIDAVKSGVPDTLLEMVGASKLYPKRNRWGDVVEYAPGWGPDILSPVATMPLKDDRVSEEIGRLRMAVRMPPKVLGGPTPAEAKAAPAMEPTMKLPGVKLTPGEYDRLVTIAAKEVRVEGKTLHAYLDALMDKTMYQTAAPLMRQNLIATVIHTFDEAAILTLRQQEPELDRELKRREDAKARILLPTTSPRSPFSGAAPGETAARMQELIRGLSR